MVALVQGKGNWKKKIPYPFEKPQEGQGVVDKKSMSSSQFFASADKPLMKTTKCIFAM